MSKSANKRGRSNTASDFHKTHLALAASLVISLAFGTQAAHAGAGWADNADKAGIPFKQATFYASSPAGLLPDLSPGAAPGAMRDTGAPIIKFKDSLPLAATSGWLVDNNQKGLSNTATGKHIPVAVKETTKTYPNLDGDYYEIAVVEYRDQFHSDLPALVKNATTHTAKGGTQLRGYVQIWNSNLPANTVKTQLYYPNGNPILDNKGQPVFCVGDAPHYLGPVILSDKGTAVRIKFDNYLPTGHYNVATGEHNGDSFIPTDLTAPGAGLGPNGSVNPIQPTAFDYYTQNRAMIHLHGGDTPWISDGEPHSWITPAGEVTQYPTGATVQNVPDMPNPGPGSQTYYFPNNQSSRMEWYHDHSFAATRLNVASGQVSAFFITDDIEKGLKATGGPLDMEEIPLVFEDRTFVPKDIAIQDAKWSVKAWGDYGDTWFPHVYESNQNPNSQDGTNPAGRWDYGPWFWPVFPAPLALPTGEFDESTGISHASGVQEMFADTPVLNGIAYPDLKIEPKPYRFRLLNGSEQRYLNLGLYVAEPLSVGVSNGGSGYGLNSTVTFEGGDYTGQPATGHLAIDSATGAIMAVIVDNAGGGYGTKTPTVTIHDPSGAGTGATFVTTINTEVPMVDAVMPPANPAYAVNTYDGRPGGIPNPAAIGPNIIHIGTEGGFLAVPNVIKSTPVSYQQLRRIVTVLNVLDHGLYVGPAERADFVIDFSQFAGKTLIVYNDAPAPNPGFDSRVDYYTGDVDYSGSGGTNTTLPGQGPNTRTIMRVNVAPALANGTVPDASFAYDPAGDGGPLASALPAAFAAGSDKPLIPESWQNTAYGTNYQDNLGRIYAGSAQQQSFTFNTQAGATLTVNPVIALDSQGVGYSSAPTVQFEGGFDAQYIDPNTGLLLASAPSTMRMASARAVLDGAGGRVSSIFLTDPGAGYTATPAINLVGGGGIGAAATAFMDQPIDPATGKPIGTAAQITVPVLSKGIQELFDPNYGRMNATFSAELPFTAVLNQTTIPLGYIDPPTEAIADGEYQIWKITHNGVDTHPVHFHLFNVQVINRVGWDGTVVALDPAEFGWKETVKMNPLEDIYVAVKPKSPAAPFGVPQSIRPLDPSQALGSAEGFSQVDPTTGLATTVVNELHNFNWEYVWHCHILGHEENDFMRVISFDFGTKNPQPVSNVTVSNGVVSWTDPTPAGMDSNGKTTIGGDKTNEIGFIVLRSDDGGLTYPKLPTIIPQSAAQPGALPNVTLANATSWTDPVPAGAIAPQYLVFGFNSAGYSTDLPAAITAGVTGYSDAAGSTPGASAAAAVSSMTASMGDFDPAAVPLGVGTLQTVGGFPVTLSWTVSSQPAGGFVLTRSGGMSQAGVALTDVVLPLSGALTSFTDTNAAEASTFTYRIKALDAKKVATATTQVVISTPYATPPDVTGLVGQAVPGGWALAWEAATVPYVTAYKLSRFEVDAAGLPIASTETAFVTKQFINPLSGTVTPPPNNYTDTSLVSGVNYVYGVAAINGNVSSKNAAPTATANGGAVAAPAAAFGLVASASNSSQVSLTWQAAAVNPGNAGKVATGYILSRMTNDPTTGLPVAATAVTLPTPVGVATTFVDSTVVDNTSYTYTLTWFNGSKANTGAAVTATVKTPFFAAGAVSGLTAVAQPAILPVQVLLNWAAAKPATGYTVYRCEETTLNAFCTAPNTVWTLVNTLTGATLGTTLTDQTVAQNTAYTYKVQAFNGDPANVSAPVTVSVATSIPAGAPATITAAVALDQVTLNWATTAAAGVSTSTTAFQVQRSADNGVTWTTLPAVARATTATQTMVDYGPFTVGQTYTYRVYGVSVTRGVTQLSPTASATATAAYIAPNAPVETTAPTFTTAAGVTSVTVKWTAGAANAGAPVTAYQVYRNGSVLPAANALAATATSFVDNTAVIGQSYTYQVVATNGIGYAAAAATTAASLTPQAAPSLVSATLNGTATAAATNATLTWTHTVDTSKPFTGYQVLNNGVPVAATINGTSATVAVTAGTNYNFTVVAVSGVAAAVPVAPVMQAIASNALTVTDVVQTAPTLAVPTFLASTGAGTQAVLSWTETPNASTYAVKGYSVYMANAGSTTYNLVGSTLATATTFTATLPTLSNSAYNFRVTAFNDAGPSVVSNVTPAINQVPAAPTQTAVTAVSATGATLHWTPATAVVNAPALTGFQVVESINGVAQAPILVNDPTATSLPVTFASGSTYTFKVQSLNAAGISALSNNTQTVASLVPNAVALPTLRSATRNIPTASSIVDTVQIRWTAPAALANGPAVTSYVVDYSADATFATGVTSQTYTGATLPTAGNSTNTTFSAVLRGTNGILATNSAYFRVRAINSLGTTTGAVLTVASPTLP